MFAQRLLQERFAYGEWRTRKRLRMDTPIEDIQRWVDQNDRPLNVLFMQKPIEYRIVDILTEEVTRF